MNNSLFTQTFTRLKPTKYLTNLARLKPCLKHLKSLSALTLATFLLAACGGGGGSSSGGGGPATTVTNFNVVPYADGMTLSWSNPARADIAFINISWDAYATTDLSRNTNGDGYLIISNSTQTAAAAANAYNITTRGQSDVGDIADGFVLGGAKLNDQNAYKFSSQLYFKASGNSTTAAAAKLPDITAPQVPRELGANPEGDSFADTQVYSVDGSLATSDNGEVTLRWTNPRVGAGNIASIRVSYVNNNSMTDSVLLRDTAHTATDGSTITYIWTGLEPGLYNFTIQPTLGGIFTGIKVAPGMTTGTRVTPPAADGELPPIVTIDPADTVAGLFPDDGAVQYTLTITQQDNITNPILSVRPSANAAVCSIALTSAIPSYISNGIVNQTTATYDVTGTAAGGNCDITFQVTEDGRSVTRRRSISFNAELPPSLTANVLGNQTAQINLPAQFNVILVINATKQDGSNTRDVTFPATVTSSSRPSCTATLIGDAADVPRQYDGITAGATTAATYNVSSTNLGPVADCGTFAFDVTEGSATVTTSLAIPSPGISFSEATNMPLPPAVTTNPVGAITGVFPDDGTVSYTLNLAKRDILTEPAVPVVNSTASTTGTCSITPTNVTPLTYNAENKASTDYNITFTGTATAVGTCTVAFVATEDGESETITRSITFSAEKAPSLSAVVMGDQTNQIEVPANLNATLVINATKQDASNTRDVTFPAMITSSTSPSCTATLIGDNADVPRQYDGITAGASTVATYNVSSTDMLPVANCGSFLFNVTEGSATVTTSLTLPSISFGEPNNIDLAPMVTTTPRDDVVRFPDDGAVVYTLNITKQDILPGPVLNATASITGSCSISPTGVRSLTYGPAPGTENFGNQASTNYTITFTGTKTAGGVCHVNFIVTEDGIMVALATRTITFSDEQAPTLVPVLLDSGRDVSSIESTRVNVTATKQDGSNTPTITFPPTIISSSTPSCTATLAGNPTRQYDGIIAGTSSVSVTYNVSPLNRAVATNCGSFAFTATEGPATGTLQFSSGINFVVGDFDGDSINDPDDNCPLIANGDQTDTDGDGFGDSCDVDDDGDGLIEIYNAAELNMMRNNLAGTSLKVNADATGNSEGCGNGGSITACNGYEQIANIDLTAAGYANWEPIGNCGSGPSCRAAEEGAQLFTGVFSGNNFIISNLFINIATERFGVGFFGAISSSAQLRNVHIRGGNITRTAVTSQYFGGLVGYVNDAIISNSSVTLDVIRGINDVGGLVGAGINVIISSSVVTVGAISGVSQIGGLVGSTDFWTISSSVVTVGAISGTSTSVGGLVGVSSSTTINSTVATVGSISGPSIIGGLVGFAERVTISSSVVLTNSINGSSTVGGLAAFIFDRLVVGIDVTDSYWDSKLVFDNAMPSASNTAGSARTTAALTNQTSFTVPADNIYATWANAWCDPATGDFITDSSSPLAIDANRVWDLGSATEYPAITCVQGFFPLDVQREASSRALAGELPLVD